MVGALGEMIKRTQPSTGTQEAWTPGKELIGDPALIGERAAQPRSLNSLFFKLHLVIPVKIMKALVLRLVS